MYHKSMFHKIILNVDDLVQQLYEEYIIECISGDVSLGTSKKLEQKDVYVWQ